MEKHPVASKDLCIEYCLVKVINYIVVRIGRRDMIEQLYKKTPLIPNQSNQSMYWLVIGTQICFCFRIIKQYMSRPARKPTLWTQPGSALARRAG